VVYELRSPLNYVSGTLTVSASISDTTLTSAAFSALPTTFSTTTYLPLVIHDPSAGTYESVWVTAHASSSTSVTVVRGREGSTARAWSSGTRVICAPTTRDVVGTTTFAGLPTDPSIGTRYALTDRQIVVERTMGGGWAPSAGVALADHVGPNRAGSNPPQNAVVLLRAGFINSASTNGSGQITVNYRAAFPNGVVGVVVTGARTLDTFHSVMSETASSFVLQVWRVTDVAPYTTAPMGAAYNVSAHYMAIGY
jgi:hypothetical protein